MHAPGVGICLQQSSDNDCIFGEADMVISVYLFT